MKKILQGISIVVISLSIAIATAELIAGLFLKTSKGSNCLNYTSEALASSGSFSSKFFHYPPNSVVRHCDVEFDYKYSINKNGLRNGSSDVNSEILAIGDSFTFGFGVADDETFPSLLHANNAGLWGNSYQAQLESFKRNVELLKPRVVIWSIYPPHFITMMRGQWSENSPGDIYISLNNELLISAVRFLNKKIILNSNLVKLIFKTLDIESLQENNNSVIIKRYATNKKEAILYDSNLGKTTYTNNPLVNESFKSDFDSTNSKIVSIFKEVKKIADQKGIEIYFYLIPSRLNLMALNGELKNQHYQGYDFNPRKMEDTFEDDLLISGFRKQQIFRLSNLEEFKGNGWEKYYFKIDAHWNSAGHQIIAKHIKLNLNNSPGSREP